MVTLICTRSITHQGRNVNFSDSKVFYPMYSRTNSVQSLDMHAIGETIA